MIKKLLTFAVVLVASIVVATSQANADSPFVSESKPDNIATYTRIRQKAHSFKGGMNDYFY